MCWKCDYLAPVCVSCDPKAFEDFCETPYIPPDRYKCHHDDLSSLLEASGQLYILSDVDQWAAGPAPQAVPRRAPALRETLLIGTTSPAPLARAQILIWADLMMN